jgi:hypothetical protein
MTSIEVRVLGEALVARKAVARDVAIHIRTLRRVREVEG